MVVGFMAFEKVARTVLVSATLVAPAVGTVDVTVGAVVVVKVAVNVRFDAPIVTSCCAVPPSDHDENTFSACGEGAVIVCFEPTVVVRVIGAVPASPPYTTCRPAGTVSRVICTVCGWTDTSVVPLTPALSVAFSRNLKKLSSPWSGTVKLPPEPVTVSSCGWVWQTPPGQC